METKYNKEHYKFIRAKSTYEINTFNKDLISKGKRLELQGAPLTMAHLSGAHLAGAVYMRQ